jgi:hypothetical protein
MAARRYRCWNGEVLRNDPYFMETMIARYPDSLLRWTLSTTRA